VIHDVPYTASDAPMACVLAVGTSSASPALTHEEADYYMGCGRIVAPPPERIPINTSPFDLFVKGNETGDWLGVRDGIRNWLVTAA
jgi:hypothetical protein